MEISDFWTCPNPCVKDFSILTCPNPCVKDFRILDPVEPLRQRFQNFGPTGTLASKISRFPDAATACAAACAGRILRSQPDPSPNAPRDQIRRKGPCCDLFPHPGCIAARAKKIRIWGFLVAFLYFVDLYRPLLGQEGSRNDRMP